MWCMCIVCAVDMQILHVSTAGTTGWTAYLHMQTPCTGRGGVFGVQCRRHCQAEVQDILLVGIMTGVACRMCGKPHAFCCPGTAVRLAVQALACSQGPPLAPKG